ncbi:unnamed protein product [Rotaria sp. Silwood1]|nr:unnamed protein product [Rotaria sp. Silwood1]
MRPLNEEHEQDFPIISKLLVTLRQQIVPYQNEYFHGRGIVLTVGPSQLELARVNLKMIEHSGTQLNVQTLNNNFIDATFAEVLFLDSDAYVTRDPIDLFVSDPMYLKFGALFFPDAYLSRQHPSVWNLLNTTCGEHEYELDSATILVDKKRVWNGIYMAKLMNDNHELFYKHVSSGDKDTFRLGFRYMDVKYYIVMIPCATGSFDGTRFCGWSLCKTDSLAQHIYINHVHLFKYEHISYTRANLGYTRIGLGDPNNNSFFFAHCRLPGASTSCFHIVKKPNPQITDSVCYTGGIQLEDTEDHQYALNESLFFEESRNNRILMSKTNNSMPHFVDNLLKYL